MKCPILLSVRQQIENKEQEGKRETHRLCLGGDISILTICPGAPVTPGWPRAPASPCEQETEALQGQGR